MIENNNNKTDFKQYNNNNINNDQENKNNININKDNKNDIYQNENVQKRENQLVSKLKQLKDFLSSPQKKRQNNENQKENSQMDFQQQQEEKQVLNLKQSQNQKQFGRQKKQINVNNQLLINKRENYYKNGSIISPYSSPNMQLLNSGKQNQNQIYSQQKSEDKQRINFSNGQVQKFNIDGSDENNKEIQEKKKQKIDRNIFQKFDIKLEENGNQQEKAQKRIERAKIGQESQSLQNSVEIYNFNGKQVQQQKDQKSDEKTKVFEISDDLEKNFCKSKNNNNQQKKVRIQQFRSFQNSPKIDKNQQKPDKILEQNFQEKMMQIRDKNVIKSQNQIINLNQKQIKMKEILNCNDKNGKQIDVKQNGQNFRYQSSENSMDFSQNSQKNSAMQCKIEKKRVDGWNKKMKFQKLNVEQGQIKEKENDRNENEIQNKKSKNNNYSQINQKSKKNTVKNRKTKKENYEKNSHENQMSSDTSQNIEEIDENDSLNLDELLEMSPKDNIGKFGIKMRKQGQFNRGGSRQGSVLDLSGYSSYRNLESSQVSGRQKLSQNSFNNNKNNNNNLKNNNNNSNCVQNSINGGFGYKKYENRKLLVIESKNQQFQEQLQKKNQDQQGLRDITQNNINIQNNDIYNTNFDKNNINNMNCYQGQFRKYDQQIKQIQRYYGGTNKENAEKLEDKKKEINTQTDDFMNMDFSQIILQEENLQDENSQQDQNKQDKENKTNNGFNMNSKQYTFMQFLRLNNFNQNNENQKAIVKQKRGYDAFIRAQQFQEKQQKKMEEIENQFTPF
ncbi:hypothetical protein PPERSA_03746 [Pseudocohnilembus persalinus]|uniref:Uncharacterized protein n=1 Tax=Pseudocohnilembus persalinus TaxID=266149 RepID=A0A0V0QHL0_PSEPJ|nr:hypothetical protein PPERSA_03746 [Pseudocohnilembus persalinus]|eukprot:KRX01662.1 hypothetical protein PPERSA_03746 [Pseudocohnilembus persalinus]